MFQTPKLGNRGKMIINIALLSLITIHATGDVISTSSEASSSPSYVFEEDFSATVSSSTARCHPARHPSLVDDPKYLYEAAFQPLKHFNIQYAPLSNRFQKSAGVNLPGNLFTVNIEHTRKPAEETLKNADKNTNKAPYFDIQRQRYRSFVPGYNLEVNRKPGYNAMYRRNPKIFEKKRNKKHKITFMGDTLEFKTPEHVETYPIPTIKPFLYPKINKMFALKPNQLNVRVEQANATVDSQNTPLYAKIQRIHLNLARVYSQGQGVPKLPTQDNDYSINMKLRKKKLPSPYPKASNTKSKLMNNKKGSDFHFLH